MLENEIIPLYFAKNSKGYSPEWIQYIKRSIGNIAPHFTMKRMIDDYIARFYEPEARRFNALKADDCKLAKEIVAWKNKVAERWDDIKLLGIDVDSHAKATGDAIKVDVKIDANGLADDLGLDFVAYLVEDGKENLHSVQPFKISKVDGNIVTFTFQGKIKDAGVYRYGYRLYPKNPNLPHRQDFAYVRWF